MIDHGPGRLNGRLQPFAGEALSNVPGIVSVASPGVGSSDLSTLHPIAPERPRAAAGSLPDFYRIADRHYRISPQLLAIAGEPSQKGFDRLESPCVAAFYAAFWLSLRRASEARGCRFKSRRAYWRYFGLLAPFQIFVIPVRTKLTST
jgi:hypothetical protein